MKRTLKMEFNLHIIKVMSTTVIQEINSIKNRLNS